MATSRVVHCFENFIGGARPEIDLLGLCTDFIFAWTHNVMWLKTEEMKCLEFIKLLRLSCMHPKQWKEIN